MLLTFADMVQHLATQVGVIPTGTYLQKVRTAVHSAWKRMHDMHTWRYFHRTAMLQIEECQQDGTIEFDKSALTVTLTDSTWPSDAIYKHVRLNNVWYGIASRTSNTVITLTSEASPPADIEAGSAYAIQKVIHPLPYTCGEVVQVLDPTHTMRLTQLSLLDTHIMSEAFGTVSQPTSYCLIGHPLYPRRWCMWIPCLVTTPTVLSYVYVARVPEPLLPSESRGTVTLASGTATFSEAVVTQDWAGSVLRISRNTEAPTSNYGSAIATDTINTDCIETIVEEYLTTTTCRVRDTTSAATAKPYEASSYIDLRQGAMEVLMQRLVEDEYGVRPVGNHMEGITSRRRVQAAVEEAMASDQTAFNSSQSIIAAWYHMRLSDLVGSVST